MENYKPNSHKSKEDRKIEKVVNGKVQIKKKNELRKLTDVFVSEDVANVKSYILMDVLIPAIKNTILDIITDSANMVFGNGKRGKQSRSIEKISYRDFSRKDDRRPITDFRSRSGFDYDDLKFYSRGDAEAVLEQMEEIIDRYGFVTVADMYDMADLTAPYTASKYGWTNIRNAEPVRVRDGYILKLPKAMPID